MFELSKTKHLRGHKFKLVKHRSNLEVRSTFSPSYQQMKQFGSTDIGCGLGYCTRNRLQRLSNTQMGFFVNWRPINPLAAQVHTGVAHQVNDQVIFFRLNVGPFQLPAPQSGTHSRISSGTRPSVWTVSDGCLKLICSLDTSAFSALEVLTTTALYKFTYLLMLLCRFLLCDVCLAAIWRNKVHQTKVRVLELPIIYNVFHQDDLYSPSKLHNMEKSSPPRYCRPAAIH